MIKYDDVIKENIKENHPNWPFIQFPIIHTEYQ